MPHPNCKIYSNAPGGNFVINPFEALMANASQVYAASAYFAGRVCAFSPPLSADFGHALCRSRDFLP